MDAAEISAMGARLDALRETLGSKAHVSLSICATAWRTGPRALLAIWPDGIGMGDQRHFAGDTFEEVISRGEEAALGIRDQRLERRVRDMAQRILEVTGDKGGCEEADLADRFTHAEIAALRDAAVRRAQELARRMTAGLEVVV